MPAEVLHVELGERSYPIYVGSGLLGGDGPLHKHLGSGPVALVTNETVAPLYLEQVRATLGDRVAMVKVLPDGEQHKNLEVVSTIFDALIDARCDRHTTIVTLGGGVVGDMGGFAAATYQRGISFVQVPTTLLAQVDSSVGGKTGVNHPRGKNMIGAFHQPRCVIADTDTLASLPSREYASGFAEIVKYGLIGDAPFYRWLQANVHRLVRRESAPVAEAIRRSCQNKARVVAMDEREAGPRALLNFGHTFAHAIETATSYARFLHGEAVAIGMLMAAEFSRRLGWIDKTEVRDLRMLLEQAGLPVEPPSGIPARRFHELMGADKKVADGRIRLVLLRSVGAAEFGADFASEQLQALLQDLLPAARNVTP